MAKKPPADQGLDSLLGELDAMSAPAAPSELPAAPVDDLDSLLDDLGVIEAPVLPDAPALTTSAEEVPPAIPRPTRAISRLLARFRNLGLIAALATSHAALFGAGFWLGGSGHGAAITAAHDEAPPALEGVLRYVGQEADAKIDGQVIFTNPEVRAAVLELSGGQALADAMTRFSRNLKSLGPVTRHGDLVEASACNPAACTREAYRLRYDRHSQQIWVCQTTPYASGASLSYLFDDEGMREVTHCIGAPPQPVSAAVPAAPGAVEPAASGASPAQQPHEAAAPAHDRAHAAGD